jgi:hypothetical protein
MIGGVTGWPVASGTFTQISPIHGNPGKGVFEKG